MGVFVVVGPRSFVGFVVFTRAPPLGDASDDGPSPLHHARMMKGEGGARVENNPETTSRRVRTRVPYTEVLCKSVALLSHTCARSRRIATNN